MPAVTVLGVGNPIMADDGIGLELLAAVMAARPNVCVEYIDGGTGGMELIPVVQDATRLLVLDAVASDRPGRVMVLDGDQLPRLLSAKLSPHQVGLLDVFTSVRLLGHEPAEVKVVGITPLKVDIALGLSPVVQDAMPDAVARACAVIDGWLAR